MTFRNNEKLQRPSWQQVFLCGGKAAPGWGNSMADGEVHRVYFPNEQRDSSRLINADRLKSTLCQRINNKPSKCLCMLLGKVTERRRGGETWGWAMSRRWQSGLKTPWLGFTHFGLHLSMRRGHCCRFGCKNHFRPDFTWHSCRVSSSMDTQGGVSFDSGSHGLDPFFSALYKYAISYAESCEVAWGKS